MNQDGDSGGGDLIGGDDIWGAVVVFVHRARSTDLFHFNEAHLCEEHCSSKWKTNRH